jgi:hypothetical protein
VYLPVVAALHKSKEFPGADPTCVHAILNYNASAVKTYNAIDIHGLFKNKNLFLPSKHSSLLQCQRCSCNVRSQSYNRELQRYNDQVSPGDLSPPHLSPHHLSPHHPSPPHPIRCRPIRRRPIHRPLLGP